jgi:ribosome-associated protein
MPDLEIKPGLVIPEEEFEFSVARSGGPGGQNVNKVNSKVVLRWNLAKSEAFSEHQKARLKARVPKRYQTTKGEVVVHSSESRDQPKNKQACTDKLAEVIRQALKRPKTRIPTKIGRGAKERRKKDKQKNKRKKQERTRKDFD